MFRSTKARIGLLILAMLGAAAMTWGISTRVWERRPAQPALQAPAAPGQAQPGNGGESTPRVGVSPGIFVPPVEPVTVNLADIRPNVYDPNGRYERLRRGEADPQDFEERESFVDEEELERLQEAALRLAPAARIQQAGQASPAAPGPILAFESLDFNDCCGGGWNTPPDPELAVGPDHIVAVVNTAFEVYDKSGTSLAGPITFASLFNLDGCAIHTGGMFDFPILFDPNVLYDEEQDRYFVGIDRVVTQLGIIYLGFSNYCTAVSATNDPTGAWHIYVFPMDASNPSGVFMDYPHAGVGREAIYMGGNLFSTGFQPTFLEGRVWALDKTSMYAGAPAGVVEHGVGIFNDTPQALNLHGFNQGTWPGGGPHYFLTETGFNGADHTLFSWQDPFGADVLTATATLDLNAASGVTAGLPIDVPQFGGDALAANDWRPLDFEYRNGYGWTAMTIACNPGAGTVDCVRWAQVDLGGGSVVQAGVFASDNEFRFFPDLAVNDCNDMAIGYTKSSISTFPGAWYTGRRDIDPPGVLQAEAELKAGEIPYTSFETGPPRRWGDYTGMTIDPDGETFWYLGEYSKDTGTTDGRWGNYVGAFRFPPCGTGGTPTPTLTPTATVTATLTATPTVTGTPGPPGTPTPSPTPVPPTYELNLPLVIRQS